MGGRPRGWHWKAYGWRFRLGRASLMPAKNACTSAGSCASKMQILRRVLGFLVPTAGRKATRRASFFAGLSPGVPQHFQAAHHRAVAPLVARDAPLKVAEDRGDRLM